MNDPLYVYGEPWAESPDIEGGAQLYVAGWIIAVLVVVLGIIIMAAAAFLELVRRLR